MTDIIFIEMRELHFFVNVEDRGEIDTVLKYVRKVIDHTRSLLGARAITFSDSAARSDGPQTADSGNTTVVVDFA